MAISMSNINNFDIDQMPSKFAQRWFFVSYFYCKKKILFEVVSMMLKIPIAYFFIVQPINDGVTREITHEAWDVRWLGFSSPFQDKSGTTTTWVE